MNTKALYGLLIAVLLPIVGYLFMKVRGNNAVVMPRHYIWDSVTTTTKNGKAYTDTVWHTVPDFELTNQMGQRVRYDDIYRVTPKGDTQGKVVVANFFFTHCPNICPPMTQAMKMLQDGIKSNDKVGNREANFIHFLSFSIDPERDSVRAIRRWADRFQVNAQEWWLLTGDRKQIYDLSNEHLKMISQGGTVDSQFLHSDRFVLIDKYRKIRGYYKVLDERNQIDTAAIVRLSQDVVLLELEKDPNRKFFLAGKLELLAIVSAIAIILVTLLLTYLKKEKKRA
jgi:protein SCO1